MYVKHQVSVAVCNFFFFSCGCRGKRFLGDFLHGSRMSLSQCRPKRPRCKRLGRSYLLQSSSTFLLSSTFSHPSPFLLFALLSHPVHLHLNRRLSFFLVFSVSLVRLRIICVLTRGGHLLETQASYTSASPTSLCLALSLSLCVSARLSHVYMRILTQP